jgi:PST family polysaccharide transporter
VLAEVFSFQIGRWYHNVNVADALAVAAPIVLVQPLAMVAYANLARQLRARDLALADLLSNLFGAALVTVPLALLQLSYWALVLGFMTQLALKAVLLVVFARVPLTVRFEIRVAASLCRQGLTYLSNGGISKLIVQTPGLIIGRLMPGAALGIFNRANSLMSYPTGVFSAVVERVAFPALSLVQDDPVRLRAGVIDAVRILSIVGIPLTVAFVLLGSDIISLLLGPQWLRAIAPFSILGLAAYFRLGDRLAWLVLRAVGKPATLAVIQLVVLIVLIGACLVGSREGLVGVAWAVVASSAVSYVLVSSAAMRSANLRLRDWALAHAQGFACGGLAFAVLGPLTIVLHRLGAPPAAVITGSMVASGLAALCAVWVAPRVFLGEAGQRVLRTVIQSGRGRWLRST